MRVENPHEALAQLALHSDANLVAGRTNLIHLIKLDVETPSHLDINRLSFAAIEELPGGKGVRIGAFARNSDVAEHPLIRDRYPVLSQAICGGTSPQLRTAATIGGNLMQRTRCYYFADPAFVQCNKRDPGSGCAALTGFNRAHAILGQTDQCIATNPSDTNVALAALDAVVRVSGWRGDREIPIADFHRLAGNTPHIDTNLQRGELITAIDLPALRFARRSSYLKTRDPATSAFALVGVAAVLDVGADGTIHEARIALGGVAHKPWRAIDAEKQLAGKVPNERAFAAAAETALANAKGYTYNKFKIELSKRSIVRALATTASLVLKDPTRA